MVRLEIFQRISKKIHELFGLTEKAAGSLQTDPFATSHSRVQTLARRTVTLSKKTSALQLCSYKILNPDEVGLVPNRSKGSVTYRHPFVRQQL